MFSINRYRNQKSEPQYLEEGKLYYMQCLLKEIKSLNHMAVGMRTPSGMEDKPISPEHFTLNVSSLGE